MKKLIRVRFGHISDGVQASPDHCPIALAIQEETGYAVWVGHGKITDKNHGWSIGMPERIKGPIEVYDEIGAMKPFNFFLEIPE